MPIVLKSGSLSLLEPSGPVQACNGIALPSEPSVNVGLRQTALLHYPNLACETVVDSTLHSALLMGL
jgi:hypothetical protein